MDNTARTRASGREKQSLILLVKCPVRGAQQPVTALPFHSMPDGGGDAASRELRQHSELSNHTMAWRQENMYMNGWRVGHRELEDTEHPPAHCQGYSGERAGEWLKASL